MNMKQTLALVLVFAFAFAAVPTVSASHGTDFGTQVKFGDNDFVPTYDSIIAPSAAHFNYVDFGETGSVLDDALYLNIDGGAASEGVEKNDIRLTAFGGKAVGSVVSESDTVETGAGVTQASVIEMFYADVDENGRYNAGDFVYLHGTASADDMIQATSGSSEWTLRLTASTWGAAGTFVLGGDQDLVVYGGTAGTEEFLLSASGSSSAIPGLVFGLFNADRSAGGSTSNINAFTNGDRLYLDSNPTSSATQAGDRVGLSSIRVSGDAGEFGSQVAFGHPDFVPELTTQSGNGFTLIRHDGGDDQTFVDDVVAIEALGISGVLNDDDIVISNGGYGGRALGDLIDSSDVLLAGKPGAALTGAEVELIYADVDNNGRYSAGDYVYLLADDGQDPGTTLKASVRGISNFFALRMTETNGGAAGSFVRNGDADLINYGGNLNEIDHDDFAFFDANLNGQFDEGDRGYFNDGSGLVDLYAIRLHGDSGDFGSQVAFGGNDFIPQMNVDTTIKVIRFDGADDDSFEDDVIAIDSNNDGSSIQRDDLVLTAGNYGGRTMGEFVKISDTLLAGQGTNDATVSLVYVDKNNNGRYDTGDWVYLRSTSGASDLVATTKGETGSVFSLRLTDTDGGNAGTFVKSGDVDLTSWSSNAKALSTVTDLGFYDADLDGNPTDGDRVYFTEGTGLVDLFAIRLVGNFDDTTGSTPTTPPVTPEEPPVTPEEPPVTPEEPPVTPEEPPVTPEEPPVTPEEEDEDDTTTPGFELVALVAALGAALVLVRRRN